MRRLISSVAALVVFAAASPAAAERSQPPGAQTRAPAQQSAPPSAAEVQSAVGEGGAWMVEYSAILTDASDVMNEIDNYTAIFDRFANGQIREREALAQIEAWRANAVARAQALRLRATGLRPPPSLAALGESGQRLEHAFAVSRADLPVLIDEMSTQLDALGALGREAVRDPDRAMETRSRAVFSSAAQLISIDLRRIQATGAALSADHPNRQIVDTTTAYYTALIAFPRHQLRVLDGGAPDPAAVATTLRTSAREMRQSLTLAATNVDRMSREMSAAVLPPEGRAMQRTVVQMMGTFPATLQQYHAVAATLDSAAAYLEGGGEVGEAWARQEEAALPLFDEIARQDAQRAALAAQLR